MYMRQLNQPRNEAYACYSLNTGSVISTHTNANLSLNHLFVLFITLGVLCATLSADSTFGDDPGGFSFLSILSSPPTPPIVASNMTAYCTNTDTPVCGANGITYANETLANLAGTIALHCGSCTGMGTAYYSCAANYTQYGSYENQSGSTLERYITCGFRSVFGGGTIAGFSGASVAELFMALIMVAFFLAFVMMQNTRIDAKMAVMIPVVIMAAIWATTGWMLTLLIFAIGVIIYLAIGKMINK
jgi:hypothetical protein